ncbi:MAG: flap endonuclease [Deltaproteobacteria bacterium]|nr:flap endonuclease [Nannocystaceae bacterium]
MRAHLVDGTYELFRAHFSPRPPRVGKDGRPLSACIGLAFSLLALLDDDDEQATHVAVAFDNPIRSFRNDLFAGYKTEEGVPPELLAQFDEAEEVTRALGVTVWSMDRFEADDALATGAALLRDEVDQVRILTPDKDLGQCVRGERVVQIDRMRKKLTDEAALRARRGVGPESIADLLALIGDTADGIPGIPGFGEKGAAAVLGHYVHIEAIPDDGRKWKVAVRGAERLAATLAARREDAALYKLLATLREDVPLDASLEALRWRGADRGSWQAWCERAAMPELIERPKQWQ